MWAITVWDSNTEVVLKSFRAPACPIATSMVMTLHRCWNKYAKYGNLSGVCLPNQNSIAEMSVLLPACLLDIFHERSLCLH